MIPHVTRYQSMREAMRFLFGPGIAGEHVEPHLVGGDDVLMAWLDATPTRSIPADIAGHLDLPRRVLGTKIKAGPVWHCSLSLRAGEGVLPDEQWGHIARDFADEMRLVDVTEERAPCRWAAVRHGVTRTGRDHIHVVANLVREDGSKVRTGQDYRQAQAAARRLEKRHQLTPLHPEARA